MFGYTITINGTEKLREGDILYENILCRNYMINKFENDKIFAETVDYLFLLDGIVLNQKELIEHNTTEGGDSSWLATLTSLYKQKGELFFSMLRGSFSGALYDKEKEKWIIFSDQIGSKFTYYVKVGNFFCCTEVMGHIYDMLKENGIKYHLDNTGAWLLLSYGFMLDDITLCSEVRKIPPGCYITLQNGVLKEHRYYLLDNTPNHSVDEKEAIEIIDTYFRKAVIGQFEKDKDYNYKHIVALSGGLDCRMTTFVAHDCGYTSQLNMTFSQSDYWDQILPMRMASALRHEWIFKALDNGIWLYNVDEVTRTTGGNVLYYGTAHSNSLYRYLNFNNLGLIHSGQLGDVIVGSWITADEERKPYTLGYKAYSQTFLDKVKNLKLSLDLNKELGLFYFRGFNGTNNGIQNVYNYTETLSPFLDLDFLENIIKIPVSLRQNHNLYKKWILAKCPLAADFEWESTGCKITAPMLRIGNKEIPWANVPHSIGEHVKMILGIKEDVNCIKSMNPVAYYYTYNEELQTFFNSYFKYVERISSPELKNAVVKIQNTGTVMEKIQVLSLLSAIKLFF